MADGFETAVCDIGGTFVPLGSLVWSTMVVEDVGTNHFSLSIYISPPLYICV